MKIEADTTVCIGAGMCVLTVPELFDQSEEDGTVMVLMPEVPADRVDAARRAITLCPSGALSII